jgi:predicted helicase
LNIGETKWKQVKLDRKMYYFTNKDNKGKSEYETGISVSNLFVINSVGIVTAADSILIADTKETLRKQILDAKENPKKGKVFGRLLNVEFSEDNIQPITYRPFDDQYIYYSAGVVERPRKKVMENYLTTDNIGLIFKRGAVEEKSAPVFVVKHISESRSWSRPGMQGVEFSAPLFLSNTDGIKSSNFNTSELSALIQNLKAEPKPDVVFDYIYAILNSRSYCATYIEFLKTDFPRVPIPTQAEFDRLVPLGRELREFHLMKSPVINDYNTTFPEAGECVVEKIVFIDEKVWINKTQYFGNVPEIAWNFYIGGYQPAQKWLKDRKGRKLSDNDLVHYQRIIKILLETDRIMKLIG